MTIANVYQELSDPKHPVASALERQQTVPDVRMIEGLPVLSDAAS